MGKRNADKVGQISIIQGVAYKVIDVCPITDEIKLDPIDNFELDRNDVDGRVVNLVDYASKLGLVDSLADRNKLTAAVCGYMGDR